MVNILKPIILISMIMSTLMTSGKINLDNYAKPRYMVGLEPVITPEYSDDNQVLDFCVFNQKLAEESASTPLNEVAEGCIVFFSDPNYSGSTTSICNQIRETPITYRSLKVGRNTVGYFWQNLGRAGPLDIVSANDKDVPEVNIQSEVVFAQGCVMLFTDANYLGDYNVYCEDTNSFGTYNGQFSSVVVPHATTLTLIDASNNQVVLTDSVTDLSVAPFNFDDVAVGMTISLIVEEECAIAYDASDVYTKYQKFCGAVDSFNPLSSLSYILLNTDTRALLYDINNNYITVSQTTYDLQAWTGLAVKAQLVSSKCVVIYTEVNYSGDRIKICKGDNLRKKLTDAGVLLKNISIITGPSTQIVIAVNNTYISVSGSIQTIAARIMQSITTNS